MRCHLYGYDFNAFVEIDVIISSHYSHGNRYYNLRLCVHVIPVCPVDITAVSGVVSVLKYCVWERGACMQSYRILCSYDCCSVISVFLWWWCCIIIASQLFICDPMEHGLKSCNSHKTLLKHFKTLRRVSILSDHHQGALFLVKVILQYSQFNSSYDAHLATAPQHSVICCHNTSFVNTNWIVNTVI